MPISGAQLLFWSCLAFIAGIFFGNFFIFPAFGLFCLGLLLLLVILALIFRFKDSKSSNIFILLFSVVIVFLMVFGWWRYEISLPNYNDLTQISGHASSSVEFTGQIKRIDKTIDSQKLTVKMNYLLKSTPLFTNSAGVKNQPLSGKVAIKAGLYPEWRLGEQVKVNCKLARPGIIEGFDYAKYLRKDNTFVYCILAEVKLVKEPPLWSFWGDIGRLKSWLKTGINNSLPEPHASIIKGIIVGDSRGIPEYYNAIFANLGLTHIIAVSGSHLVEVFAVVFALLLLLGVRRQKTFWPAAIIISGYVILVGAPASAVRSAIMALAVLYAVSLGRLTQAKNILAFTGALMLLVNPFTLVDDIGFQLSFASVLGLSYLLPIINFHTRSWPDFRGIKEIFLTTLSAQIFTLPLIVYCFGRLSLLSLPANLLILPVIPPLMILGALNALIGAICPGLGQISGWPTWLIVQYWLKVSEMISSWPLSSVSLKGFGWPALVLSYIILIAFIWRQRKKYGII